MVKFRFVRYIQKTKKNLRLFVIVYICQMYSVRRFPRKKIAHFSQNAQNGEIHYKRNRRLIFGQYEAVSKIN